MNRLTKVSALIAPAFALVLAGCGSSSPPESDTAEESASPAAADDTAEDSGGDFCATLIEVSGHFGLLETGTTADAAETAEAAAQARELLESVEAPAEMADSWADITAFYVALDDAFAEADIAPGQLTYEVLGDDPTDITSTAVAAQEGMRTAEGYAAEHCGADGETAAATGACTMLTDADLQRVFGDAIPEAEDGSFGPQAQECVWEADDGSIVSIMYQTRADFESNFLESSAEPRDTVDGIENGQVHKGVFGLGSFDTRGSSVYFTIGDWGGVASVRTGEDDNFANDDPIAIDFATKVVDQLS